MKINSQNALVAYLDILGYSSLVNEVYANICYASIDAAISGWNVKLEGHKHNCGEILRRHVSLQVISDSFIIIFDEEAALREMGAKNKDKEIRSIFLRIFLVLVSYLVQDCMRRLKRLFRGAVVRGCYFQERLSSLEGGMFIFSKALCEAHKIEKEICELPRILIDKSVLEAVDYNSFYENTNPDRELFRSNADDGMPYLNVYGSIITTNLLTSVLREMACFLKECIIITNKDLRILKKYTWFANYHNQSILNIINSNAIVSIPCLNEVRIESPSLFVELPDLV